jgi:hypothetical protein
MTRGKHRKRKVMKTALLVLFSSLFWLLLFELVARVLIEPSDICYGKIFGREVPPFKIPLPDLQRPVDYNDWYGKFVVNNLKLTRGDLFGIHRSDGALGYAPLENAISQNGWWQSNNIGARSRKNTAPHKEPGSMRVLVFGESFTNCSQVPQEETWTFYLETMLGNVEVVNLAADGYGMAQCFLRYRKSKATVDYDVVLLVFVPAVDLMRDINVLRSLFGWESREVMPRFVLTEDSLQLIESPYKSREDFLNDCREDECGKLRDHLRAFDRFYFRTKYESPPLIGRSVFYKLGARAYFNGKRRSMTKNLMNPRSEALQVSRRIFEAMNREVEKEGKKFVLFLLPVKRDVSNYKTDVSSKKQWDEMSTFLKTADLVCVDLMKDYLTVPDDRYDSDYGFKGHYGPKANRVIAELVKNHLVGEGWLSQSSIRKSKIFKAEYIARTR